jgi:hypothetical protein
VPYAFAIAALVTGKLDDGWVEEDPREELPFTNPIL